ncbi:MAG TPA: hypothetical protein VHS80_13900 [Chthoniobacterales bacterium]|jgi:hypothetical protein|nr:hypothetical protein [Chthoniobacterales bacterium]
MKATIEETIRKLERGERMSWAAKYFPAMEITDQALADRYFAACLQHHLMVSEPGLSAAKAAEIERSNLGYWGGYCSRETRIRVEELFRCEHPILGKAALRDWTSKEIMFAGIEYAREHFAQKRKRQKYNQF